MEDASSVTTNSMAKGRATLRINHQIHHVPCGRQFAGLPVRVLVEGLDISLIGVDGQPV
jgi:hypothetical protein